MRMRTASKWWLGLAHFRGCGVSDCAPAVEQQGGMFGLDGGGKVEGVCSCGTAGAGALRAALETNCTLDQFCVWMELTAFRSAT